MKMGRNDPCFCGSGEKYKKCCQTKNNSNTSKNREWVEANIIKTGDMLLYGKLHDEMDTIPADVFWKELRRIAEIYLNTEKDRAKTMHTMVDSTIESLIERDKRFGYPEPFCHKGCCNCCHELVYCTSEEAERIFEYCETNRIEINYEKLSRQLDFIEFDGSMNHTGITTWNDQPIEDQSCAFLNETEKCCSIWPARPLVCRVHLAEKTNQYCAPHNGTENLDAHGINYIELSYILSVIFTIHRDSIKKTMGKLLLDSKPNPINL